MTILKIAAAVTAVTALAAAGPIALVGMVTGVIPQKLWQLARRRSHG